MGTRVSLVPNVFTLHSSRTSVERQLKDAGFTRLPAELFETGPFHDDLVQGREIYSREGGNLVCNIQLFVVVSFDQQGLLSFGESAQYVEGCL